MTRSASIRRLALGALAPGALALGACSDLAPERVSAPSITPAAPHEAPHEGPHETQASLAADEPDALLRGYLASRGFTGRVASTLETRLGRRVDPQLADIGR